MEPLISIIIPVYNVEIYLCRCIDSVIYQTYTNLEIILIDDGSLDDCPAICDEYVKKDSRIFVIHKVNGGLSDARNAGMEIAKGEYIYYLDSDDELPQNAIRALAETAVRFPSAEIIIGEMKSKPYRVAYCSTFLKNKDFIEGNEQIRKLFFRAKNRLPVNACNKLIKKDFLITNEISFMQDLIHEDELWMFQIVQHASKIALSHSTTYIRYINPNSITTGTIQEKKDLAWGNILDIIFSNISNPCETELFFTYTMLWMKHFRSHDKNFHSSWSKMDIFLKRKKMSFIRMLLVFFKASHPVLKGHGIGFVIWFLVRYGYKQNV